MPTLGTDPKEMARTTDPVTSHEAAEKVDSRTLELMVLKAIHESPDGLTTDELMRHFPAYGVQTVSPRFAPLLRKGLIYDTGLRRKGASGVCQRVVKSTDLASTIL